MLRCAHVPALALLACAWLGGCGGGGNSDSSPMQSAPAAPILTLAATSVVIGSSTTLTWSSVNATSCTASGSWSGTLATSGTQTLKPATTGTFTYTLACANSTGASKASSATLTADSNQAPAAPTVTLLTSTPIYAETSASIGWSSVNATSCTPSGTIWGGIATLPPSGEFVWSAPPAGSQTFTLTCANSVGSSPPTTITVTITPDPPAPSGLSYSPQQPFYYVGKPIIPLTPTVTGDVVSWSPPVLPPGLTFDSANGVISGTPTSVSSDTLVICASNQGGQDCVKLKFGTEIPPSFFYGSCSPQVALQTVQYTVGVPAQPLTPLIQGHCYDAYSNGVQPWSISSALPAGLTFDTTTGVISGTPTQTSAPANYVITGGGPGGQMSAQLTIGVSSNVVLNLGHAVELQFIQLDAAHVLSQDVSGHWVLWNYATMAQIASGDSAASAPLGGGNSQPVSVYLAGPTVAVVTSTGLEMRSSATGAVLAEIAVPLGVWWWQLATDGSYVCALNNASLTCWSPTGQRLFSESGNYSLAEVFAAPSGLLVAQGAAGANVIETVSSATWTSSVGSAFQGEFESWFVDGSAFLTRYNNTTVSVYSPAATLVDRATVTTNSVLNGVGHWFWGESGDPSLNTLVLYAVGNSATPTATYAVNSPTASGAYITWVSGTGPGALTAINLSGATPVVSTFNVPTSESIYAFNSPTQYMAGTNGGLLIDESTPGSPRTFDYGAVTNMAGGMARAVFTTASGNTFSYNTTTNAFESTVDLSSSLQYVMSADGSVLATRELGTGASAETVDIYSLPSKALINSFSYASGTYPLNITLSAPGTTLGELLLSGVQQSLAVTGGTPTVYATQGAEPVQLSPNATLVALSSLAPGPATRTALYNNDTYVTTVVGYALGWLDNARLLVDTYDSQHGFIGANIFSPTGGLLAVAPFGPFDTMQVVSSNFVYAPQLNQVLPLSGANGAWASGDLCGAVTAYDNGEPYRYTSCSGAFAGSAVVFASGNLVIAAAVLNPRCLKTLIARPLICAEAMACKDRQFCFSRSLSHLAAGEAEEVVAPRRRATTTTTSTAPPFSYGSPNYQYTAGISGKYSDAE